MDQEQGYAALKSVVPSITLEEVNVVSARLLAFSAHYAAARPATLGGGSAGLGVGSLPAPPQGMATAAVACVPTTYVNEEGTEVRHVMYNAGLRQRGGMYMGGEGGCP